MKYPYLLVITILVLFISCDNSMKPIVKSSGDGPREISFYTPDSIKIIGDLYEVNKEKTTILLFHQGGSNARAEYITIIPKLIEKGYNILATDQRIGGQIYGYFNRTLVDITSNSYDDGYTYCDAYNNLESALDFVIEKGFTGKKIVWGSSYSAALAIQLANNRQSDLSGVLAFSPVSGGPMEECRPDQFFETLKLPLLILRPPNEMQSETSKQQFELAKASNHQTYAAEFGVHGSSMLVKERVGHDVAKNWEVVYSFLADID